MCRLISLCWEHLSCLVTEPIKWLCTQQRLRSAWSSAQSEQSLHWALNGVLRTKAFFMRTAKTDQNGRMHRLIWVFAGCICHFVGFVTRRLKCHFVGFTVLRIQLFLFIFTRPCYLCIFYISMAIFIFVTLFCDTSVLEYLFLWYICT